MPSEPAGRPGSPVAAPAPPTGEPRFRWGRPLAFATAAVFLLSLGFPAVAAFVRDTESWPKWWGVLDVGLAFLLAALAIAIMALAGGRLDGQVEIASYRAYRVLIHGIFAMLVAFWLCGDRIVWGNCLTGFAWRFWLLLYALPAWIAVSRSLRPGEDDGTY
jgi:hypothetical protein